MIRILRRPLVLGARRELLGRPDGSTRGDAAHEAFHSGEVARGRHRVVVGDLHDLIDHVEVGVARDETGADALTSSVRARKTE